MSARIERGWLVFNSIENDEHNRCVDFFRRQDGTYGFEEFRRDPEDAGLWTPVAYHSVATFTTSEAVANAAASSIPWLALRQKGQVT